MGGVTLITTHSGKGTIMTRTTRIPLTLVAGLLVACVSLPLKGCGQSSEQLPQEVTTRYENFIDIPTRFDYPADFLEWWGDDQVTTDSFITAYEHTARSELTEKQRRFVETDITPRLKFATYQFYIASENEIPDQWEAAGSTTRFIPEIYTLLFAIEHPEEAPNLPTETELPTRAPAPFTAPKPVPDEPAS